MIQRLHISQRDRLLAAGLLSLIVAFLLLGGVNTHLAVTLLILGVFIAGAIVFSQFRRFCAALLPRKVWADILFLLPPLAYIIVLFSVLFFGVFMDRGSNLVA